MKMSQNRGVGVGGIITLISAISLLVSNTTSATTYPQLILSDNPVVYYEFEELQGASQAMDSTTNGINATYTYDTGNAGTFPELGLPGIDTNSIFLKFYTDTNSTVHYGDVDIPYSALLNPVQTNGSGLGTAFSAEIWLQPTVQPGAGDYRVPFSEFGGYGSGIYANASGWNFYQSPGPSSYWILNVHQAGIFAQITSIPIQLLNWYHLAVTFDNTNFIFYINGAPVSTNNGVGYLANPGADGHIGTGFNVGFNPFDGGVDEAAIYGYALSSAQILAHYQLGTNSFRVANTPPSFITLPASQTNYSGTPVTFTASANGTTPLHYQWFRGATPINSATSASYTFTSQYPADNNATFSVTVSNIVSTTNSGPVTLTVLTNVNIINPPASVTRNSGSNSWVAFRVAANGALPISYQWYDITTGPSVLIPGATNDTLWIKGLSTNASYDVTVSNPFISSNVGPAALTVQPRPVNVPITKYAQVVVADSPVAYWRLDETNADGGTATDAVGSFDGTYTDNAGSFLFNAATGIPHETDGAVGLTNGSTIQIPFAQELNPVGPWSAETWLQPYSLGANGGDYRVVLSSQFNVFPNPYNGWYIYQQPGANNFAFAPQPGNGFITANPDDPANSNQLVPFKWYHLVVTDDGTTFTVYINGEARSSFPVAQDQFIPNGAGVLPNGTIAQSPGAGNTVIGQRTDAAFNTFIGTADDTAFYNYALSAQQVQLHYLNQVRLSFATAQNKLILSWPVGKLLSSTNVTGPYAPVIGATSPYTNSAASSTFYRVQSQP